MKKLILVLAVLLAVPALALNISLEKQVADGNKVDLKYAGADPCNLPRAFALKIVVDSPAKIVDVTGFKTGVSEAASAGYGIYPATIIIDGNTGIVVADGNPLAAPGDPGAGDGQGTNNIVLEFGSLYAPVGDSVNAPPTSGTLCALTMDCNGAVQEVNIVATEEDTYRGGVVLEQGDTPDPNLTASLLYDECGAQECMKTTASGYPAGDPGQGYINWVAAGNPDCWCYEYQHLGDVDGKEQGTGAFAKRVSGDDLDLFAPVYGKKRSQLVGDEICADLDHLDQGTGAFAKAVASVDLDILATNFGKKTSQLDSSPYAGDYNSWIIPTP